MNFSAHDGFKNQKLWPWWSAVGLVAFVVALLWLSYEKNSAQTAVPENHNSSDDQNSVQAGTGRRHQGIAVQTTAEPVPQPPDTASVESIADRDTWSNPSDRSETGLVDRTPRPLTRRQLVNPQSPLARTCFNNLDSPCMTEQALLTESIDPNWSSMTEGRLRDIWREYVTEMSDDFLFVECKTTVCEVTYRFPQGTTGDNTNRYMRQFLVAFRASDLAAELRVSSHGSGGLAQAEYFKRTTVKSEP